ncbi:hypothetical protein J2847_005814 [Azospirillum agricola]|uniref:hypothetical protein n=1 Tax=Azospirillum agricola TaxID=1720247 RepID=UPI001AE631B8|nr:hypothetical protein [Azospirillum agricola]MBP2232485.1 hypothetical protein [Azospirillum agricola]
MQRSTILTKAFTEAGDFVAVRAAERWLAENGFSVGRMQAHAPRGILMGDNWDIQKWRNLTRKERAELDGILIGDRNGPAEILMFDGGIGAQFQAEVDGAQHIIAAHRHG